MISRFLDRLFHLTTHHTSIRQELVGGVTTFLTMVYIVVINPTILQAAGMDLGSTFVATCLVAAAGSLLMGFLANYPIAIASGMGLNAYFSYIIVKHLGFSWQSALGLVFVSGILFLLATLSRFRQRAIEAIPPSLIAAISAGLGLFLAIIALQSGDILVADPMTFATLGNIASLPAVLFFMCFYLIIALERFEVPGAMIISIVITTCLGILLRVSQYHGIVSMPPNALSTFMKIDLTSTFHQEGFMIIFTFFLISFFDSTGTLVGLLQQSDLKDRPEYARNISRGMLVDSLATILGALLGTSTTTPYIESATGIRAGGKTGLTSITVGILFLFTLFLSPLAQTIPAYATSPALLFVACLMLKQVAKIHWDSFTDAIPSAMTLILIPLTYSIALGVGFGFISYTIIKILSGKIRELNGILIGLAIMFVIYLALKP
ncbi:MAG: guanine permease [Gammaproteobacteria bacterium GWF2_41_13]|nr:MAG: guanine permease [Gammaproteobacteria bacterium GWF2_41_13]